MYRGGLRNVLAFFAVAFTLAITIDLAALYFNIFSVPLGVIEWGILRMWSVSLAVVISIALSRESVSSSLKSLLHFSRKTIIYYVLSPLLVYLALGLYVAFSTPLGFFRVDAYINTIFAVLKQRLPAASPDQLYELARAAAFVEITLGAYLAALTVNALLALGEELGWRGYLYKLLGATPNLENTLAIGGVWGLWHAPAIVLLGYNYPVNRSFGVVLFTLLCIALTYPLLLVTDRAGSVLPAASLHGGVNALWSLTIIASTLPPGERELYLGMGVLGILSWTTLSLTLYITGRIARRPSGETLT